MRVCHLASAVDRASLKRISDSFFGYGREVGPYYFPSFWQGNQPVWAICPDRWLAGHIERWLLRDDGTEDWEEYGLVWIDDFMASFRFGSLEAV